MNVDNEKSASRLNTCKQCPSYKDGVCASCGCIMFLKVLLKSSKCPEGKWDSENA